MKYVNTNILLIIEKKEIIFTLATRPNQTMATNIHFLRAADWMSRHHFIPNIFTFHTNSKIFRNKTNQANTIKPLNCVSSSHYLQKLHIFVYISCIVITIIREPDMIHTDMDCIGQNM